MLITLHLYLKRLLDGGNRSANIDNHPIGMLIGNRKAVIREIRDDGLKILFRGPELFGELVRRQILAVSWTGGIVDFGEKIGQAHRIAQRQTHRKRQATIGWKPFERLQL